MKTFLVIVATAFFAAVFYWLTLQEDWDPCDNLDGDIVAAIISDDLDDQDVLVNRAIAVRGVCESKD